MTQREIKHAPGDLPACLPCSTATRRAEPRHVLDLRAIRCGGGHFLECSRCDRRTAKHRDLEGAGAEWLAGTKHGHRFNAANMIFCTGSPDPIPLDQAARRFTVVKL